MPECCYFSIFVAHNQNAADKCDTYISSQKQITPWKTFSCLVDDIYEAIFTAKPAGL